MQNVFLKMSVFAVVVAGASLAGGADAQAADKCERLVANINWCNSYPPNECPTFDQLTFTQQRNYWNKNLVPIGGKAAVVEACRRYFENHNEAGSVDAVLLPSGGWETGGQCTLNGAPSVLISLWSGSREPQCELTLNADNPYHELATASSYARGTQFKSRASIIQKNKDNHSPSPFNQKVRSDVPDLDLFEILSHSTSLPDPEDDIYNGVPTLPVPNRAQDRIDYANIDHIIPRVDIFGCECGTNSPLNAAVISRVVNIDMSNNMNHAERIEILRRFTNYNAIFGPP